MTRRRGSRWRRRSGAASTPTLRARPGTAPGAARSCRGPRWSEPDTPRGRSSRAPGCRAARRRARRAASSSRPHGCAHAEGPIIAVFCGRRQMLLYMPGGAPMRIGVVFPQTEIGQDPAMIRDYAQAVESLGYTHILAFDSVVGPNPDRPGGWDSQFDYRHAFHEPFVLFGFCAGVTRRIELVTGIIILPQRQTALVAKQAAAVDVLSAGRLRLGIGVGWNTLEF